MASGHGISSCPDTLELQQALATGILELKYERSLRAVESINKDEERRRLKCLILVQEDKNEELHNQLAEEEDRLDQLEATLHDANTSLEESAAEVQRLANELRLKTREMETTKAELDSLQNISSDSAKILRDKLALARELSTLKPELEHLRSQAISDQNVLSEKLSLQSRLSTVQVELENANRSMQQALAREGEMKIQDAARLTQLEELRSSLDNEKREREMAEKTNRSQQEALAKEGKMRMQDAAISNQVEELRSSLDKERQEREIAENVTHSLQQALAKAGEIKTQESASLAQIEELRSSLAKEKHERDIAKREAKEAETEWEAQKSVLEDKVGQFRSKLKAAKEKLKDAETQLQGAQQAAAAAAVTSKPTSRIAQSIETDVPARNARKRAAVQMDPDAAIGTPGNGTLAKRGKRCSSTVPGDKSTFSITPFLNRTASIAPEDASRNGAGEDGEQDDAGNGARSNTPSAAPEENRTGSKKAASGRKPKPLTAASSGKTNARPTKQRKGKAAVPALEKVAEEGDSDKEGATAASRAGVAQENASIAPALPASTTLESTRLPSKPVLKKSAPKALTSFASFNDSEILPEKKKRRLPGNSSLLGKTLFDDDEESQSKALAFGTLGGIGGQRAFGSFAARSMLGQGKGASGSLGNGRFKGLITAKDGFQFSPLKKDRQKALLSEATA